MRAVDILLLALATLIGLLTLALQPWTLQWWAAIIVAVIIALAALVHMIMSAKGVSVKMSTWAPWFLILGGPLAGFLWLYIATPATPSPQIAISIGSLRYVVFIADVVRDTISKQTSVQMIV
jgi:hypothetical protein